MFWGLYWGTLISGNYHRERERERERERDREREREMGLDVVLGLSDNLPKFGVSDYIHYLPGAYEAPTFCYFTTPTYSENQQT